MLFVSAVTGFQSTMENMQKNAAFVSKISIVATDILERADQSMHLQWEFLLSYPQELRLDNHGLELKRRSSHFLAWPRGKRRKASFTELPAEFPAFLPLVDIGCVVLPSVRLLAQFLKGNESC
ncbi:hypothetical protein AVEN_51886-1 [Araneus ventricosus]|uniref:Uncharacterized protein n=1 Tax=Araneus ventricosus TaxID=182803 RepID=A0A4Y2JKM5_ARAVE|nr:hypothetical protein AVEN_51886-1 [Araneus ventricosus]